MGLFYRVDVEEGDGGHRFELRGYVEDGVDLYGTKRFTIAQPESEARGERESTAFDSSLRLTRQATVQIERVTTPT